MFNNNINQNTDISTLQFICKLHNFMHIISMQSNEAAITLSVSGQICDIHSNWISKIWIWYLPKCINIINKIIEIKWNYFAMHLFHCILLLLQWLHSCDKTIRWIIMLFQAEDKLPCISQYSLHRDRHVQTSCSNSKLTYAIFLNTMHMYNKIHNAHWKWFYIICCIKLGRFWRNMVHSFLNKSATKPCVCLAVCHLTWIMSLYATLWNLKCSSCTCYQPTTKLSEKVTPKFISPQLWPPNSLIWIQLITACGCTPIHRCTPIHPHLHTPSAREGVQNPVSLKVPPATANQVGDAAGGWWPVGRCLVKKLWNKNCFCRHMMIQI